MSLKTIMALVIAAAISFGAGWWSAKRVGQGPIPASANEMHALLGSALDMPGTLGRSKELVRLAYYVDDETIPGVARAFEERLRTVEAFEFKIFAEIWAKHGPEKMLDTVNQWESLRHDQIATSAAVYAWMAQGQVDQAVSFAGSQTDRVARQGAQIALLVAWVESDPDRSLDEYINSFKGEAHERLTSVATSLILKKRGEAELRAWIDRIPADSMHEYKSLAFHRAIRLLARQDVEAAKKWVATDQNESWAKQSQKMLARTWAISDPLAAIEWAIEIQGTEARMGAMNAALRQWEGAEPDALAAWIEGQEPVARYDESLERLALKFAARSPKRAAELAERITDEDQRAQVLERVANISKKYRPRRSPDAKSAP